MLLWAVDRPEREALAAPERVRVESIPAEPLRDPDLGRVEVLVPRYGSGTVLEALEADRLRAALDVTDPEPLPPDDPLWSAPNLLLTPHMAGDTPRRFRHSWRFVGEQVTRLHAGLPLENVILAAGDLSREERR